MRMNNIIDTILVQL